MALSKIELSTAWLTLYIDDQDAIVFHQLSRSLFRLPALSVACLLGLDQGQTDKQIVADLISLNSLSAEQILPTLTQVKSLFEPTESQLSYADGRYPELAPALSGQIYTPAPDCFTCQVAKATFAVQSNSQEVLLAINTLLSPCAASVSQVNFQITIVSRGEQLQIYCNDLLIEDDIPFDYVMPLLMDRLQILAFQYSDYYYCFHGAALKTAHGLLLLPGESGAGKSTLSAILASQSNQLYSDEIIAFDKHFDLIDLYLPIAIKSGSWSLLQSDYPELVDVQIWQRADGRQLKYVWPKIPKDNNAEQTAEPKQTLLISPNFLHHEKSNPSEPLPKAEPLTVFDTLALITSAGYQLGIELDEERLDALLDFLNATPCYQVTYSNTAQALQQLERLWPEK